MIAKTYTIEQINEKITFYEAKLEKAADFITADMDTSQTRARTQTDDTARLSKLLNSYLTAKVIKQGNGGATLKAARYTRGGTRP